MRRLPSHATRLGLAALSIVALVACPKPLPPAAPPPPPAPPEQTIVTDGDVEIVVSGNTCTVTPPKVVIDYPTSQGKPIKVKFKVKKAKTQEVQIVAAQGQVEPDLFDPLPKFDKGKDTDEKEAKPVRTPPWRNGEFKFNYKVVVDTVICDPEICVRQGGSGCSG